MTGRMRALRTCSLLSLVLLASGCGSVQTGPGHAGSRRPAKPRPPAHDSRVRAQSAEHAASPAPPPQALVTDETQNRLLVVDLPSGRIARSVPLPASPQDIATVGDGGVVIVVSSGTGKVTVLDRRTLRTIRTFGGFGQPHIVAISPDGGYAYITDDARGILTVIRLSDMKLTSRSWVGAGAHHLSFSRDEHQVWVALSEAAREITLLTTSVGKPSSPVIDPGHPRVIGRFTPGFAVHDLAFGLDGRTIWVTSAAGPLVTVFGVRSHRALFRVPVGAPPQHVALQGRYAYLTSGYGSTIEKVDAATGHVITRAAAPYGSFELAVADGYVATSSLLLGTLAIYTPDLELLRVVKLAPATREVAISRP
jgi:DNA-binding beta-propeller fold protein YncE